MPGTPIAAPEVSLARIVALGLAGPVGDPLAVAQHLGSMQAQDLPGALVSLALRTTTRSLAGVVAAFDEGRVVRGWTQRGTLHVVPAADLAWMLRLTGPRMASAAASRHRQLGIDDDVVREARRVAERLVADGSRTTRAALFQAWADAGLVPGIAQRDVHLLSLLCRERVLVLGPLAPTRTGWEQLLVAGEHWLPTSDLGEDEALARWTHAFFTSHGPASEADLARWSGLTLTRVRRGIAANPQLLRVELAGEQLLMAPDLPDRLAQQRRQATGTLLLPGFDELLLGYRDRSRTCPPAFASAVCPGNNGMFRATVVDAGQVVATWRRGVATQRRPAPPPQFTWLVEPSGALERRALRAWERLPA